MKIRLFIAVMFIVGTQIMLAQKSIPAGFIFMDDGGMSNGKFSFDIDSDGKMDSVAFIQRNDEDNPDYQVLISLSSNNGKYFTFPYGNQMFDAEFSNSVLKLSINPQGSKFWESMKFKYYPQLKSLRLIGYDFNSDDYGNTTSISINLLTNMANKTEKVKGRKAIVKAIKTNFPVITYDKITVDLITKFNL